MSGELNIRQALRVFHIITSHGTRTEEGFRLSGLTASSDFDGYTVTIRNDYVCLDIFFHNKYTFTCDNRKEKEAFLYKIKQIDRSSNSEYGK